MEPQSRAKNWEEGLHPTTVAVIETCASAAQDTILMMTIAEQRDLVSKLSSFVCADGHVLVR
jgi:hypothetical protein